MVIIVHSATLEHYAVCAAHHYGRQDDELNRTHRSTTDPDARLMRKGKGKEARLVFMGHALMENRHGLLVDFQVTHATGTAERDMVPKLLDEAKERRFHPKTLGGDKGYDAQDCVADMRDRRVTPHVAQNTSNRRSAIDGRTTRHPGYAVSQRIRTRVKEILGWMKTVGSFHRTATEGSTVPVWPGTWSRPPTTS